MRRSLETYKKGKIKPVKFEDTDIFLAYSLEMENTDNSRNINSLCGFIVLL